MSETSIQHPPAVPLSQAAFRCGLYYQKAFNMLLSGELRGWQTAKGRWMVEVASVEEFVKARERTAASREV